VKPPEPAKTEPPAAKTAPEVAPAAIEIKLPEGAKVDAAVLDGFKTIAKEHGLNSKQAQAMVDFQIKQQVVLQEHMQKQRVADLELVKGDKEFGGAKYDQTVAASKSALKQFGGGDVSTLLEQSGLDCHPAVVKMFARIRSALAEDSTASRLQAPPPDAKPPQPKTMTGRIAARYASNVTSKK
jgi:hypothetical protein